MEEGTHVFKMLTGKPTGNRPLGRPKRRYEVEIRINLKEKGSYEELDRFGSG